MMRTGKGIRGEADEDRRGEGGGGDADAEGRGLFSWISLRTIYQVCFSRLTGST